MSRSKKSVPAALSPGAAGPDSGRIGTGATDPDTPARADVLTASAGAVGRFQIADDALDAALQDSAMDGLGELGEAERKLVRQLVRRDRAPVAILSAPLPPAAPPPAADTPPAGVVQPNLFGTGAPVPGRVAVADAVLPPDASTGPVWSDTLALRRREAGGEADQAPAPLDEDATQWVRPGGVPERLVSDDYPFWMALEVRWHDCDPSGFVHSVGCEALFESLLHRYLSDAGVLDPQRDEQVGHVIDSHRRHHAPLPFTDRVGGGLAVEWCGDDAVVWRIGLFRQDQSDAAVECRLTMVWRERSTHQPCAVPLPVREAVEVLMPDATEPPLPNW